MSRPRPRAAKRPRRAKASGARVVWPPSERQSARDAIAELLRERGLGEGFDGEVERAANAACARVPSEGREPGRRDLRDLPTFTIDPHSARDFDDALSAEALAGGASRVWVHIADVAAFVEEGSAVDLEARRRGTSVYVPGGVRPMLPEALSGDACSLLPEAERRAVTVELELRGAEVVSASFYRSTIRSDARLDYEQVDRIFASEERAREPWRAPLQSAREAAAALARDREQRGALVLDSQEPEFRFDAQGNVSEIRARSQTEAHRLIEHLMIAANEAVARLLERLRVPCLYRVHEQPDPESIVRLADQLASLDVPTPPLPEHLSPSQAAALVGAISRRVEETVRRNGRGRTALSALVLRSLKQAYYLPRNLGHAGLRSAAYCHFTSPIRRYPDLVCHRALLSAIGAGVSAPRAGELAEVGAWCSEREREAMAIEHDADDVARCFALEQSLYETGSEQPFTGEVVGLITAGAFVAFGGPVAGAAAEAHDAEAPPGADGAHVYEGLLPVRRLRGFARRAGQGGQATGTGGEAAGTGGEAASRSRGAPARSRAGEWWELNELGTILHEQSSGATLRLGEQIEIRVATVEATRGRVGVLPAADERRE